MGQFMLNAIIAGLAALSMATTPVISDDAADAPPSQKITIDVMTVQGSGCRKDTASVAVSADNTAFTVSYSTFTALVGVGATPLDNRKQCMLSLRVNVPSGFTFAVASADYRGFYSLAKGAKATHRTNYYFQSMPESAQSEYTYKGEKEDYFNQRDELPVSALVYQPCGMKLNFNVNTELRTFVGTSNPANTTSYITLDSTDGGIKTKYHFSWLHCK
jgi:hypothetical protein